PATDWPGLRGRFRAAARSPADSARRSFAGSCLQRRNPPLRLPLPQYLVEPPNKNSLDRCDCLDLQPDLWRHELLDHEQRVGRQGFAFEKLRVEFAAQTIEDRQIVLATQQRPQRDDVLHLPARSLNRGLQVPEYLVELGGEVIADHLALLVQRNLASDDDQAIKGLEVNAEGQGVNRHSRVFAAHRLVNIRGLHYFILHRYLLSLWIFFLCLHGSIFISPGWLPVIGS